MNELAALKASAKKVLVFSRRNQVVIFLKTLQTITAFFLNHAGNTNAVGLHMSALQSRIAHRVAGRNLFFLSSSIHFLIFTP